MKGGTKIGHAPPLHFRKDFERGSIVPVRTHDEGEHSSLELGLLVGPAPGKVLGVHSHFAQASTRRFCTALHDKGF